MSGKQLITTTEYSSSGAPYGTGTEESMEMKTTPTTPTTQTRLTMVHQAEVVINQVEGSGLSGSGAGGHNRHRRRTRLGTRCRRAFI